MASFVPPPPPPPPQPLCDPLLTPGASKMTFAWEIALGIKQLWKIVLTAEKLTSPNYPKDSGFRPVYFEFAKLRAFRAYVLYMTRSGSRTAAISKMELFVIIFKCFQPLTIITRGSILDVAAVLDPPLMHTCLSGLNYYVSTSFTCLRAYVLTYFSCLHASKLYMPKCLSNLNNVATLNRVLMCP